MKTKFVLFLFVLLPSLLFTPDTTAAAQIGEIEYGMTVEEVLTPDMPAHDWKFGGFQGDVVTIQMDALLDSGPGLPDMLLILVSQAGAELATADGGDEASARIEMFELPDTGAYYITATTYSKESSGRYQLGLDFVDGPAQTSRAIEYVGSINYGQSVSAELAPDVVAHLWEFGGRQGDEIAIAMDALDEQLDPLLLLLTMSEGELQAFLTLPQEQLEFLDGAAAEYGYLLAGNNDRGEDRNAVIPSFFLPADGRYFIVATSCCTGHSAGPYQLALELIPRKVTVTVPPIIPELHNVDPAQGQQGSQLPLSLTGVGFSEIGILQGVALGVLEIPFEDLTLVSDELLNITILIPQDAPAGEQALSFFFENFAFDFPFLVTEPPPTETETPEPTVTEPVGQTPATAVPVVIPSPVTVTPSPIPPPTVTPTATPSATATATPTPSATATAMPTPSATVVPTATPSATVEPTATSERGTEEPTGIAASATPAVTNGRDEEPQIPLFYAVLFFVVSLGGPVVLGRLKASVKPFLTAGENAPPPPAPPPPRLRFKHDWRVRGVSIDTGGKALTLNMDIRFRLGVARNAQRVEIHGSSLIS